MLACASSWALSCPQEGRQDTCGDSSGRGTVQFHIYPQNRAECSTWLLVPVNSLGKRDLRQLSLLSNETDAAIQLSASFFCGRRDSQTSGACTHHSSIFQTVFRSTQHTKAFLQCSEEPDGFKKTHFASKVAYGILINNRLIDLSPLKNLIWLLAHLLVPGKCYKRRVALDQPCRPFGDILHGPPGDHIRRRWQTEEPQGQFSCP